MAQRDTVQVHTSVEEGIAEIVASEVAPSCFLPGTKIQFAWDSTSLGYLKTCPRLYQYQMIEGWQAKGENIHLFFGQVYHSGLELYERLRMDEVEHEEALLQVVHEVLKLTWTDGPWEVDEGTKAGKYKNRRTLVRAVIYNLDYYNKPSPDPAETFKLESGEAAVELSFRFELDWGPYGGNNQESHDGGQTLTQKQPYLLCGHLDRVVSFNSQLFVMDHKTTTTTPSDYYFDQYSPNNQMTLYTLASQIVLDAPIKGVIIDAHQLLVDSDRCVRGFTYRTQGVLDEWLRDLEFWLNQAEAFAEADYWPQNDTACDKFGGCKFRGICSKDPGVREKFLKASFVQLPPEERWNPLKVR